MPRIPRVGMVHPGLFCVIRPNGCVAMFRDRLEALRWLRVEALERGRQTQHRRRQDRYVELLREVHAEEARLAVASLDAVWAAVLPVDPHPPGPNRA